MTADPLFDLFLILALFLFSMLSAMGLVGLASALRARR